MYSIDKCQVELGIEPDVYRPHLKNLSFFQYPIVASRFGYTGERARENEFVIKPPINVVVDDGVGCRLALPTLKRKRSDAGDRTMADETRAEMQDQKELQMQYEKEIDELKQKYQVNQLSLEEHNRQCQQALDTLQNAQKQSQTRHRKALIALQSEKATLEQQIMQQQSAKLFVTNKLNELESELKKAQEALNAKVTNDLNFKEQLEALTRDNLTLTADLQRARSDAATALRTVAEKRSSDVKIKHLEGMLALNSTHMMQALAEKERGQQDIDALRETVNQQASEIEKLTTELHKSQGNAKLQVTDPTVDISTNEVNDDMLITEPSPIMVQAAKPPASRKILSIVRKLPEPAAPVEAPPPDPALVEMLTSQPTAVISQATAQLNQNDQVSDALKTNLIDAFGELSWESALQSLLRILDYDTQYAMGWSTRQFSDLKGNEISTARNLVDDELKPQTPELLKFYRTKNTLFQ